MRFVVKVLFFIAATPLFAAYFDHPPSNWQCIEDPAQLPKTVHVLYVGQGTTRFAPTIHLSSEPLSSPFDEYVETAKSYHQRSPGASCEEIGTLETYSGTGRIIRIDSPSVYGDVCLLQAYILHQGRAFVVTGTSLKEDFVSFANEFYKTVQSFHLKNDLQVKSERD